MVIENSYEYTQFIKSVTGKNVSAVAVSDDNRNHCVESDSIIISLMCDDKIYDIVYDHSESPSSGLDMSELSCIKRFWVDDIKEFYHLTGFTNIYDVKLYAHLNRIEYNISEIPYIFTHMYDMCYKSSRLNTIISLTKVLEHCHDRLNTMSDILNKIVVTKYFIRYNSAMKTLAELEHPGMRIINGSFNTVFKRGYGYSNYNMLTSTGRPSNSFRGVNFGALNKKDGTRSNITTRFEKGLLVEFDYDAYHLRLLGKIVNFDLPTDISLHQYFADEVYKTSYDDAKRLSWQILYGNVKVTKKDNPFFYKIDKMADSLWRHFNTNKHFKSHIYRRPFVLASIPDANKNKVLNYFIQSYETERNIETINKVHEFLNSRSTRMILYTYDSFLFDLDRTEGLRLVLGIKEILQAGLFPVKVKAGMNYGSMQDITERLNGFE